MNQSEALQLAQDEAPELFEKTANILALTEKLDPESAQAVVKDFEEILNYTSEKVAKAGAMAGDIARGLGVAAIGGVGLALASDMYDVAKRGLTAAHNYKAILRANPDILNQVGSPKDFKDAFKTVHRFAPEFTADPILAGGLVKAMANLPPEARSATVERLISSRKLLGEAKNKSFPTNFKLDKPEKPSAKGGHGGQSNHP